MTQPPPRKLTVLVGNGVSIAFDRGLILSNICDVLFEQIKASGASGDAIALTMQTIARRTNTGDPRADFEVLVGAFGSESQTLDQLERLARFVDPTDSTIGDALRTAAEFARSINDTGTSYVLETISKLSHANLDKKSGLNRFVDALVNSYDGEIVIANLNYDTLLLSSLSESHGYSFCDQGDGRYPMTVTMPNGCRYTAYRLRSRQDFCNRVHLVQLHGSLTFWRMEDGTMLKMPVDSVRSPELWRAVREEKDCKERPLVVLASQQDKSGLITQEPFALAYREFTDGLEKADDWLVVGYSFRDDCVNERLADAFKRHPRTPEVLVVTYGNELTQRQVETAFGWDSAQDGPADWLTINRDGVDDMADSLDWALFKPPPASGSIAS